MDETVSARSRYNPNTMSHQIRSFPPLNLYSKSISVPGFAPNVDFQTPKDTFLVYSEPYVKLDLHQKTNTSRVRVFGWNRCTASTSVNLPAQSITSNLKRIQACLTHKLIDQHLGQHTVSGRASGSGPKHTIAFE